MILPISRSRAWLGAGLSVCFFAAFYGCSILMRRLTDDNTERIWLDVALRCVFGIAALRAFLWLVRAERPGEELNMHGFGRGMLAGSAFLLFTVYLAVYCVFCVSGYVPVTPALFGGLIAQQLATGFWEELCFRGLAMRGFFGKSNGKLVPLLGLCMLSAVLFGLAHITPGMTLDGALYAAVRTGILGFGLATVYLCSGSIISAMVLHAVFDIPASILTLVSGYNTGSFRQTMETMYKPMYAVVFITGVLFVILTWLRQRKNCGKTT